MKNATEHLILRTLHDEGSLSTIMLANDLGLSPSWTSSVLGRMRTDGLVDRRTRWDGAFAHANVYRLTRKGRAKLRALEGRTDG